LPIYFYFDPDINIDNLAIITTINDLAIYDININQAIIYSYYGSLENISQLLSSNLSFITKIPNIKYFRELIETHGQDLQSAENSLSFSDKPLYGKKVLISVYDKQLYAYIMLDNQQKAVDEKILFEKYEDDPDRLRKINQNLDTLGKFIILSSDNHKIEDILSLYYNREIIEQVSDMDKDFAGLDQLKANYTEIIRGRLLLSFISKVIFTRISQKLNESYINTRSILYHMYNLKIKIYETATLLEELTKPQKEVFVKLNLDCPFQEETGGLPRDCFLLKHKPAASLSERLPKQSKNKKNPSK
ncbi:MAG: hypothetical protein LBE31_05785, partial [Deltaproteobacteria bacterium]|nr:hypothetical protein [Deltaproteobacteria bacterium]